MTQTESQNCPLCANPAEYYPADRGNRKHFLCSNCTQYQISRGAETRLQRSPTEWKLKFSLLAKNNPSGCTLVITLPAGPPEEGIANPALAHEYVENSKLHG